MFTVSNGSQPNNPTFPNINYVTVTTDVINQQSNVPPRSNISIASGHRTILVQDVKTTCHPRRHSFIFISSNVSFFITYSKMPIKGSVKYLGQISYAATQLPSLVF